MTRPRKSFKRKRRRFPPKTYLILTFIIAFITFLLVIVGFYLYRLGFDAGYKEGVGKCYTSFAAIRKKEQEALKKILDTRLSEIEDFEKNTYDIAQSSSSSVEESSVRQRSSSSSSSQNARKAHYALHKAKKPLLAIIIDDVAYRYQVNAIKRLGIKLNLSFFPPSARHPYTWKYAKEFKHYMVHLPMEATNFSHEEQETLHVDSSTRYIERVIRSIRRHFPRAHFINNHTGSKFTANLQAMERLIPILTRYGFVFVDSRTTPLTQVKRVVQKYGYPYIKRDIFLDNKQDISYIRNQLKKAVHIAQRRGYAIAIGHPHHATLQALANSQDILNKVKLIYIDELYRKEK